MGKRGRLQIPAGAALHRVRRTTDRRVALEFRWWQDGHQMHGTRVIGETRWAALIAPIEPIRRAVFCERHGMAGSGGPATYQTLGDRYGFSRQRAFQLVKQAAAEIATSLERRP